MKEEGRKGDGRTDGRTDGRGQGIFCLPRTFITPEVFETEWAKSPLLETRSMIASEIIITPLCLLVNGDGGKGGKMYLISPFPNA